MVIRVDLWSDQHLQSSRTYLLLHSIFGWMDGYRLVYVTHVSTGLHKEGRKKQILPVWLCEGDARTTSLLRKQRNEKATKNSLQQARREEVLPSFIISVVVVVVVVVLSTRLSNERKQAFDPNINEASNVTCTAAFDFVWSPFPSKRQAAKIKNTFD